MYLLLKVDGFRDAILYAPECALKMLLKLSRAM